MRSTRPKPRPKRPVPSNTAIRRAVSSEATAIPTNTAEQRVSGWLILPALILGGVSVALGFGGEVLLQLADQASASLIETSSYVEAVIGR